MIYGVVAGAIALACTVAWMVGEIQDLKLLRRVCGTAILLLALSAALMPLAEYWLESRQKPAADTVLIRGWLAAADHSLRTNHEDQLKDELGVLLDRVNDRSRSAQVMQELRESTKRLQQR